MPESYWNTVAMSRFGRRRFVALSTSAGALAMMACSGSNSNANVTRPAAPTQSAALVGTPAGTAAAPRASSVAAAASGTPPSDGVSHMLPPSNPQAKRGGHYGNIFSSSTNFNVVSNFYEGANLSGVHLYDRLISSRTDQRRYVFEAAQSAEQPDPLTVTIKLKPGMVYQNLPPVNGRAVAADDIVQVQQYGIQKSAAFDNGFQKTFLDSTTAPDPQTVVFKLKQPYAYTFGGKALGSNTAQCIIPKELLDNLDTNKPVGSGPWYLADYTLNARYLYKRFDQYHDAAQGLPYIDEHELIAMVDPVAQEAAFRSEQIQIWAPPIGQLDKLISDLGSKVIHDQAPGFGFFAWYLNTAKAPWNDARVRQALWLVTNRKQINDLVFSGKAVVPVGPIPAGLTAYQLSLNDVAPYYVNDPQKAKQLLSAAGFDTSQEYEIICSVTSPTNEQTGQVWQQQLTPIGVKVRVTSLPFAEWIGSRIAPGKFDIVAGGSPGDDTPATVMRYYHSDDHSQFGGFGVRDPYVDALIEKSEQATDFNTNVSLVRQAQLLILQKYGSPYELITTNVDSLRNSKLHDYEINPAGTAMYQTQMWFSA